MNKSVKRVACLGLSAMTAFSVVGCNKDDKQTNDPETTPLVFSIGALDGNFNPFFATSASDVTIAAQTQIAMLSTDENEKPVCGEDQPTVALTYKETMKDSNGQVTDKGDSNGTTEYEFVIKNGIKFSDGTPLTIKDVLFNLYVYLEPMYSGSATLYSTKIQGLEAYRQQEPGLLNDDAAEEMEYEQNADTRFNSFSAYLADSKNNSHDNADEDIALLKEIYEEVLISDWNNYSSSLASYQEEYRFTKGWELFLFVNGLVEVQTRTTTSGTENLKDGDGKYYTTLDTIQTGSMQEQADHLIEEIEEATDSANYAANLAAHKAKYPDCTCEGDLAKEHVTRDAAIACVFNNYTTTNSGLWTVLNYTSAGDEFYTSILQDEMDAWRKELGDDLAVETISGITTYKTSSFYGQNLGEEHDVLKVVIDGVDPKAIWNMAFTVAPMHYYSSAEEVAKADGSTHFGVKFMDKDFFQNVLQASSKNALPVGAGVYMASNAGDSGTVEGKNFYNNNIVYYKRNPYFETVGDDLCNAKIKYMRYKVVGSDQIFNSLVQEEVHVGEPNATPENAKKLTDYTSYLGYGKYLTNGYGYVGINPKFVPDLEVRQLIMKAMNTNAIVSDYYTTDWAVSIQRPMSTTSWAYPTGATRPDSISFTRVKSDITSVLADIGYTSDSDNDGALEKDGHELEYTFTIAGETTDHPAYTMFQEAATFLNQCGFKISVVTDPNALKKLASGSLTVWAAAWSSAIDPDLYQVYHKDSKATSVKNWGYDEIKRDTTKYSREWEIIAGEGGLSDLIEQARATINESTRTALYAQALDKIMALAVELPTYQRNDLVVYNRKLIDESTINTNPSHTSGVFDKLWLVNYN